MALALDLRLLLLLLLKLRQSRRVACVRRAWLSSRLRLCACVKGGDGLEGEDASCYHMRLCIHLYTHTHTQTHLAPKVLQEYLFWPLAQDLE